MRFKKKILEHVAEVVCDSRITCDLCGDANPPVGWDQSEVTIDARLGNTYPEGDFRKAHEVDVCAKCFIDKVSPALAAIGLVFRVRDIDDDGRVFESL